MSAIVEWTPSFGLVATKHLELRRRRGLMTAAVVLLVALPVFVLGVRLVFHAVNPDGYGPAGSLNLFVYLTDLMAQLGFIVAVAVGASAGTTDLTDGVFRHLVITGRSRVALYLARLPAGLAILLPLAAVGFAFMSLVTGLAGTANGPNLNEMVKAGLWLELEIGIGVVVGLGFGSLVGQRTLPIVALTALQIIVTPILAGYAIPYFLNGQRLVFGVAMDQLRPAALTTVTSAPHVLGGAGGLQIPAMPTWAMIAVIAGWIVGWTVIGAWRMATRDA